MLFILLSFCFLFVPTEGNTCRAGSLFSEATGKCYYFFSTPFTFAQAEKFCAGTMKGHLPSINTAYEKIALEEFAISSFESGGETFWTGGRMSGSRIQWTDGNPVTYTNWNNGPPTNPAPNSCIQSSISQGLWSLADCGTKNPFVCESPSSPCNSLPAPPPVLRPIARPVQRPVVRPFQRPFAPPPSGCRPGWLHFAPARSCYKVIYNVNWDEGELACQREGAHLASIHSEAENQFLLGATMQNAKCDFDNQIWIGLRNRNPGRAPHSSYFSWSDNSQKGFTRYNIYEPNNANNVEYCVQLCNMPGCNNGYDKTWNDYTCSKRLRAAICKKPEGR